MRTMILLLSGCLMAQGCQSQSNKAQPSAVPATQEEVVMANEEQRVGEAQGAAAPPRMGKLSSVEGARLKGLAWVGDASATTVRPFNGRYAQSGYWKDAPGGKRRTLLVGEGRYAGPKDEIGYVIVDTTPEGARLKLFRGQTFTPKDVTMEMPVSGVVEKMAAVAAHDQLAVLGWDGAKPQLTVYRQANKKQVWSVPLDIEPGVGPMVLAWYDTGELIVERRGADTYERVIVDGKTGAVLLREQLDERIAQVIFDPVKFILEQPWVEPTDKIDESKLTTAQRFVRNPGRSLGAVCMMAQRETRSIRVVELEDGLLLIAEGTHGDGGDGYARRDPSWNMRHARLGEDAAPDEAPRHPLSDGATCSAVTLMDSKTIQFKGRWSTGRADQGAR
jgi:hypothetical protein